LYLKGEKMKVKYMKGFKALTGKLDEMVYCLEKKSGACWAREYVVPELTENNQNMASRSANLSNFYKAVSSGYLHDLKDYCDRYNLMTVGRGGRCNSSSLVIKMMYALKKEIPSLDLATITPAGVVAAELPVRSLCEAVENGILPIVSRYQELENWIL
jgi:hypothetical protein